MPSDEGVRAVRSIADEVLVRARRDVGGLMIDPVTGKCSWGTCWVTDCGLYSYVRDGCQMTTKGFLP
jgi:hypothetical protein